MDISNNLLIQWITGMGNSSITLPYSFQSFYEIAHCVNYGGTNPSAMTSKMRTDVSNLSEVYINTSWADNAGKAFGNYPINAILIGV